MERQDLEQEVQEQKPRRKSLLRRIGIPLCYAGILGAGVVLAELKTGCISDLCAVPDVEKAVAPLGEAIAESANSVFSASAGSGYNREAYPKVLYARGESSQQKKKFLVFGEDLNPGSLDIDVLYDENTGPIKVKVSYIKRKRPTTLWGYSGIEEGDSVIEEKRFPYKPGLAQEILDSYDPKIFLRQGVNPVEIEKIKRMLNHYTGDVDARSNDIDGRRNY